MFARIILKVYTFKPSTSVLAVVNKDRDKQPHSPAEGHQNTEKQSKKLELVPGDHRYGLSEMRKEHYKHIKEFYILLICSETVEE
jgi:hypothetical protein